MNEKSIGIFILLLAYCIGIIGCTGSAHLYYSPSPLFDSSTGKGRTIKLIVNDKRRNKTFSRTSPPAATLYLKDTPQNIVQKSLSKALETSGFMLSQNSTLQYQADIVDFYLQWPAGFGVPVTGIISLSVKVIEEKNLLVQKEISEQFVEVAGGGGFPAIPVAQRVIQRCLTKVIDNSIRNPDILATLSDRQGRKKKKEERFIVDSTPPVIVITQPNMKRGINLVSKTSKVIVKGKAIDNSGIFEVRINGVEASLSSNGTFWSEVLLAIGENKIHVTATDTRNNVQNKIFTVLREKKSSSSTIVARQEKPSLGGNYYALLIAVQEYHSKEIYDLDYPVHDAQALKYVLATHYNFSPQNIELLKNPSRGEIIEVFDTFSQQLTEEDNFLIFFAGHGYWDKRFDQGYWLPSNASRNKRTNWISNGTIRDFVRGIRSRHTLLIADACFSGGIFKTRKAFTEISPAIEKLYQLPSRKAITSGILTEVPDKSVFMEYLLKRLKENEEEFLSSEKLFISFREAVVNNSPINQIPQYGEIRETGDEGGDFIFIREQ